MAGRSKVNRKQTQAQVIEEDLIKYVRRVPNGRTFSEKLRIILEHYAGNNTPIAEELQRIKGDYEFEKEWREETEEMLEDMQNRMNFQRHNPKFGFPYPSTDPLGGFGASFCLNTPAMIASGKEFLDLATFFRTSKNGEELLESIQSVAHYSTLNTGKRKCVDCGLIASVKSNDWKKQDKPGIYLCQRCYHIRSKL